MLHARSDADSVSWRVTLSLPIPGESAGLARLLAEQLAALGATEANVTLPGPPATVIATFADTLDTSTIQRVVLTTLRAADYVHALELDSSAPNPLLESTVNPSTEDPAPRSPSAFEQIGDDAPSSPEDTPASPLSGFEQIGPGTQDASAAATSIDALTLVEHVIDSNGRDVDAHFIFSAPLDPALRHTLEDALTRTTATRFDAYVELTEPREVPERSIHLLLAPALSTANERDVDALRQDCIRFARRVREFGELGVSLAELLDLERLPRPNTSARASSTAPREEEAREEADVSGFVLDLNDANPSSAYEDETELGMPARSAGLTAGDFADPRLRREDATAELVDVVLRHPGYSDKNISKVLSILLSIEYSKALMLAQSAPCVIAWGIGQERALTMKNVIESGGGRVVLVEPDTFASS